MPRNWVEFDWPRVLRRAGRSFSTSPTETLPVSKNSSPPTEVIGTVEFEVRTADARTGDGDVALVGGGVRILAGFELGFGVQGGGIVGLAGGGLFGALGLLRISLRGEGAEEPDKGDGAQSARAECHGHGVESLSTSKSVGSGLWRGGDIPMATGSLAMLMPPPRDINVT